MNFSKQTALISLCSILSAGTAFADFCTTQSHGLFFRAHDMDVNSATSFVINECTANPLTNNNECSQNLSCDQHGQDPYPSGQIACVTRSRIGFQASGSADSINSVVSGLINQCTANQVTNNNECSQNLMCSDLNAANLPYPDGQVVCFTDSHDLHFEQRGAVADINSLVSGAINQCNANSVTNNAECSQNLNCRAGWDHGPGPGHDHMITCHTESHSIPFSQSGPASSIDQMTSQIINECNANPVTVNAECSANFACN